MEIINNILECGTPVGLILIMEWNIETHGRVSN